MLNFETALDVIETAFSRPLCCLAFFIISTLQSFSISFLFNITCTFITLFYLHVFLIICLKRWYFSLILTMYCSQDLFPHLIIAPNAGIAAYPSWLPTIVCHDTLKHFSLSNFCAFVCKKILARKLLLFTFFFFLR